MAILSSPGMSTPIYTYTYIYLKIDIYEIGTITRHITSLELNGIPLPCAICQSLNHLT